MLEEQVVPVPFSDESFRRKRIVREGVFNTLNMEHLMERFNIYSEDNPPPSEDEEETTEETTTSRYTYLVPIWAEENAALAATTYEWAYGNGASTPNDGGVTIYVPKRQLCHVVAMSLRLGSGTATVELVHNGAVKGSAAQVAIASRQSATNELDPPLEIVDNDYINFRTLAAAGTSAPNVVTAWLRYTVL